MSAKRRKPNSRLGRKENNREPRQVKEDKPLMLFSFKDFDKNQIPPGQSYEDWQDEKLLAYALEKFGHICEMNRFEAIQNGYIKIYGDFPTGSKFIIPRHIENDVQWAVIMKIKGQKGRIAGHIIGHVFYIVFLDKEHDFYPTSKKNT